MNEHNIGPTIAIETLGCKVNQYEASCLLEILKLEGFTQVNFRDRADIYIINSCAVTDRAGFQSRQLLRRARRANPLARVVAAGCYAKLDAERIAAEGLATHILGNSEKFNLVSCLRLPGTFSSPCQLVGNIAGSRSNFLTVPVSRMHTGRTRAVLKIQDGCSASCSYCVVPQVRGRPRSLPLPEVLAMMARLVEAGHREIVLTGIHLGNWGKDLGSGENLLSLLSAARHADHPQRLRLSSLEPMEISPDLINFIGSNSWMCPHFHVPLQSGDAEILGRMRRPYDPSAYAEVIMRVHEAMPEAAIGADVLVGFPGESEGQFLNTYRFIHKLPISYIHVFPFSPRPGTPAAKFPDQIAGPEIKRRAKLLRTLARHKKLEFRSKFVGGRLRTLIETQLNEDSWEGLSGNYIRVIVQSKGDLHPGTVVDAEITGFRGEDLTGEVCNARSG